MHSDAFAANASWIDPTDREEMGRLMVAAQRRLEPYIARAVRDHHVTEDLLQETLLTLIERLGDLQHRECFWPWIFRVAQRKIQDHFRRRERWGIVKQNAGHEASLRFRARYAEPDVLERIIRAEHTRRLCDAIEAMDGHQQQIVRLRCFEQMPYAQIAAGTQTNSAQVRTNLHRTKRSLRKQLQALSA